MNKRIRKKREKAKRTQGNKLVKEILFDKLVAFIERRQNGKLKREPKAGQLWPR